MNLFILGLVLDTAGKLLIGIVVLMVHRHIFKEHGIEVSVLRTMKAEWIVTILGILLIITGAVLQLVFHLE